MTLESLVLVALERGDVGLMSWLLEPNRSGSTGAGKGPARGREGGSCDGFSGVGAGGGGDGREAAPDVRVPPLLRLLLRLGGVALERVVRSGCEEAMDWVADHIQEETAMTGSMAPGDLGLVAARNGDLAALAWLAARLRYTPTEAGFSRAVKWSCPLPALRCMAAVAAAGAQGAQQQQQPAASGSAAVSSSAVLDGGGGYDCGWDWAAAARLARNRAEWRAGEEPGRICLWLEALARAAAAAGAGAPAAGAAEAAPATSPVA